MSRVNETVLEATTNIPADSLSINQQLPPQSLNMNSTPYTVHMPWLIPISFIHSSIYMDTLENINKLLFK